jgi:hypothetical protein
MVKFVIVGVRRTGTTLIRTTLDSHPDIRCFGASFRMGGRLTQSEGESFEHSYQKYLSGSLVRRMRDFIAPRHMVYEYLDALLNVPGKKAVGFKLLAYDYPQYPTVIKYLHENNFRVIHVVRSNLLKTLISRHVKKVRRFGKATTEVKRTQIALREDRLLKDLRKLEQQNEAWVAEAKGLPYMRTTYEDFVANKEQELQRMLEFLDVEFRPDLQSPLVKVNPDDIRSIITNYDAVADTLRGTPYEWCLQS